MPESAGTFYLPEALRLALAQQVHPSTGTGGFLIQALRGADLLLSNPSFQIGPNDQL